MKIMKVSKARQINKSRELGVLLGSTLMQRRILYSCLAIMNPVVPHLQGLTHREIREWVLDNGREADGLRTYHIDIKDFAEVWGMTHQKDVIGKLHDAIGYDESNGTAKIMGMYFKHKDADTSSKDIEFINIMSKVKIVPDKGVLTVRFTDDILPYLINLASYTTIPLKATVGFKCNYSFGMLEYLLRRYTRGGDYPSHDLSLDALHMTLGTDKVKSYKQWSNFKDKVLDSIERDFSLIAGGGYDLKFEPIRSKNKRGRPSVEGVTIHFSNAGVKRFSEATQAKKTGLGWLLDTTEDELLPTGVAESVKRERAKQKGLQPQTTKEPVNPEIQEEFLFPDGW